MVLSIALHLLVLLFSPLFIQTRFPPGGSVGAPRTSTGGPFGMQAINVVPSETAPDLPETTPTEQAPVPAARTPAPAPAAETPVSGGGSDAPAAPGTGGGDPVEPAGEGGDALRPGYRDPRMYVLPNPYERLDNRTDHERYMERFSARIDAVNDSMGMAAARNSTTSDWTVTDGEGRRWGLSPEGLHLGGVTIPRAVLPLPGATGDNASQEAAREEERQRQEIIRQEAERERRETQNERIREMQDTRGTGSGSSGSSGTGGSTSP